MQSNETTLSTGCSPLAEMTPLKATTPLPPGSQPEVDEPEAAPRSA